MGVSQDEPTPAKASTPKDDAIDEPEETFAIPLDTVKAPTAPMDTIKNIPSVHKEFPDGFNTYGLPSVDKLPIHTPKTSVDDTQAAAEAVPTTKESEDLFDSKGRKLREVTAEEVDKCLTGTRCIKEKKMWFDTGYRCTNYFKYQMGVANPSHCKLCPQSYRTATQLANHYTKKHVGEVSPSAPCLDKLKEMALQGELELEDDYFESSSSSSEDDEGNKKDKSIKEEEKEKEPEEELDLNVSNDSQSSSSSTETVKTQRMSVPVDKDLIQFKINAND